MTFCKCGCGLTCTKNYKRGHGSRCGAGMSGKHHSEAAKRRNRDKHLGIIKGSMSAEVKKKISESLQGEKSINFGKHLSNETKEKIRLGNKGKYVSEETRKKLSVKAAGRLFSTEHRLHISKALAGLCIGEKNSFFGKKHSKEGREIQSRKSSIWHRDESNKRRMRLCAIKAHLTMAKNGWRSKPELQAEKILKALAVNFIAQYPVLDIEHAYVADFYLPEDKVIIEIDGLYWHNFPHGKVLDHLRKKELLERGYTIVRFWENEIYKIKEYLLGYLKNVRWHK